MSALCEASSHRLLIGTFKPPTLGIEHRIDCRTLSDTAGKQLMVAAGTIGIIRDVAHCSFADKASLFQRLQLPPGHRPVGTSERLGG